MIHYSLPGQTADRERSGFSAIEFKFPTPNMNAAEITLTTRYPETGLSINRKSDMIVRILKGSVTFSSEGETIDLPEGATILVPTEKKYFWLPHGSVTLFTVSSPPWTQEQNEYVPE
jgi:mannose-6-phosphate isomerase-like protein (cupin superfamily)